MFGLENASGVDGAAIVVGAVLAEVIMLYVGYGALEKVLGPALVNAVKGE